MLSKEQKSAIVAQHGKSVHDTGATAVQIALITHRIAYITEHLKQFPKDKHSYRGLAKLLGQRRSLQKYAARSAR